MQKETEVELIPWYHDFVSWYHGKVIDFIKSLPKNSVIAMELTPKMQFPEERNFIAVGSVEEALHECRKRNLRILPIEVPAAKRRKVSPKNEKGQLEWLRRREQKMIEQIRMHLQKFKGSKFYVVSGSGHAAALQKGLEEHGIKTRVNTDIFGEEKEKMEHSIEMEKKRRKLIDSGKPAEGLDSKLPIKLRLKLSDSDLEWGKKRWNTTGYELKETLTREKLEKKIEKEINKMRREKFERAERKLEARKRKLQAEKQKRKATKTGRKTRRKPARAGR